MLVRMTHPLFFYLKAQRVLIKSEALYQVRLIVKNREKGAMCPDKERSSLSSPLNLRNFY